MKSFQEKSRNLMIKSRVLRVICPLKMHFSPKSNPTVSQKFCLWQLVVITSGKTAEYDKMCRLLYKSKGLGAA